MEEEEGPFLQGDRIRDRVFQPRLSLPTGLAHRLGNVSHALLTTIQLFLHLLHVQA